jgi:hypothetical protein
MPGLAPDIHEFQRFSKRDVDGRDKPGHDTCHSATTGMPSARAAALSRRS